MGSQHTLCSIFLLLFFLSSLLQAVNGDKPATKLYVVYLGERQHEDPELVTDSHHDLLSSLFESKEEAVSSVVYSYRHGFSGFAAMLTQSQADQLAELPGIISVEPNRMIPLHTTRSWDFLGLGYGPDRPAGLLLQRGNFGEDVIIGVVDTGIWPESRSFDDHGYGPIPSRWKGTCQVGQNFTVNNCNRKIIGARWYTGGIDPSDAAVDYLSARDYNGHGTHTASTAAGSVVSDVSFHGLGAGTARGGAPRARVAVYKACWGVGLCSVATVLKSVDDAVHDGVDVLSLSLGGQFNQSFASLHAVAKGITVIFSAGNAGPISQTLSNDLPWTITVAASSIDRSFPTVVTFGDNQTVVGQSLSYSNASADHGFKDLVVITNCLAASLNSRKVVGKIVLCADALFSPDTIAAGAAAGSSQFLLVVYSLQEAKAKGVIFARFSFVLPYCETFICILVDNDVLWEIYKFGTNSRFPKVMVSRPYTIVGSRVVAPRVASFSSKGPSLFYPDLLKPDIMAPGVNILAAMRDSYVFETGTSMSCPHVAGVAALLKGAHPSWSPAAIRSALVTTAYTTNAYGFPIEAEGTLRKLADPFDFGGGHIDPNRAIDPGLIYDIGPKDYFKFFHCTNIALSNACELVYQRLYHLNLPSVAISDLKTSVKVQRTITNVGNVCSTYNAVVVSPPGVKVKVEPPVLEFNASKKVQTFALTFTALVAVQGDFNFGSLTWVDDGKHSVRIPIAVRIIVQDHYSDA